MRKTVTTYTCDRCGVDEMFAGVSPEKQSRMLNDDGWRDIAIRSMSFVDSSVDASLFGDPSPSDAATFGKRLLCRLCYVGFVAFMELPATGSMFEISTFNITGTDDSQSSET